MSDKNPFSSMATDWLEAQRKYMEAWSAMSQDAVNRASSDAEKSAGFAWDDLPVNKALESWWKSVSSTADPDTRAFYDKLMNQSQVFYFVTDQICRFMQSISDTARQTDQWRQELEKQFDEMKAFLTSSQQESGKILGGMFGAWQMPMDTWQRTLSTGSVFPGDFLQGFKPDDIQQATDRFLSVPGVGYSRGSQEQLQAGMRLWMRYQYTYAEYQTALGKAGIQALDHMKVRILAMPEQGESINSLRELYDLWVDCNEKAYAEYAYTEDYSKLYGRLVNDLMAVKQHGRVFMDEIMSAFSMPTRKEINTMQKRQQQNRRAAMETRQKLQALDAKLQGVDKLRQEVSSLRAQLQKQETAAQGSKKKKAVTKKKPATRKKSGAKRS